MTRSVINTACLRVAVDAMVAFVSKHDASMIPVEVAKPADLLALLCAAQSVAVRVQDAGKAVEMLRNFIQGAQRYSGIPAMAQVIILVRAAQLPSILTHITTAMRAVSSSTRKDMFEMARFYANPDILPSLNGIIIGIVESLHPGHKMRHLLLNALIQSISQEGFSKERQRRLQKGFAHCVTTSDAWDETRLNTHDLLQGFANGDMVKVGIGFVSTARITMCEQWQSTLFPYNWHDLDEAVQGAVGVRLEEEANTELARMLLYLIKEGDPRLWAITRMASVAKQAEE